ncbi:MAG TPA: DNA-3-methyladenine glycosylase 2 family protein, partial [Candidatus Limnocylindria bacterium]|nr:DNA-3-methyladenine glycosylase 2 family protein [Candidatus Limnocylindria bacterium]
PAVLEQKVTGREAWRGYRLLLRHISEPAPGPIPLLLPGDPQRVAGLPSYEMHRFGIERRRAELLRRVAMEAPRLERADRDEAYARMRAVPGIGPWTVAEVGRLAYGDPDAVSVGDFHLPSLVAWAFTGERQADDTRMLELLEPYRGQRGRVQRLLELSGLRPPRHGPRLAPRRIEEI